MNTDRHGKWVGRCDNPKMPYHCDAAGQTFPIGSHVRLKHYPSDHGIVVGYGKFMGRERTVVKYADGSKLGRGSENLELYEEGTDEPITTTTSTGGDTHNGDPRDARGAVSH